MRKEINGILLELFQGDISRQPSYEAVVNAANAELRPGGGVAGAIHRKAGPRLDKECRKHAPIETGEAVLTDAYNLPNEKVIHTLGPVYGREKSPKQSLASCYRNSLSLAEENDINSVLFPAISTGAFGYPLEEAASVALKATIEKTKELSEVKKVGHILHNKRDQELFERRFRE